MQKFIKNHRAESLFIFAMFCVFLLLSIVIPFNQAPDESSRYLLAEYMFKHKSLPLGTNPEVRIPIWGISYAFSPFLSYMLSSILMTVTSLITVDSNILLISARFANVICSTITIILIMAISEELFSKKEKWIFIILCSTFPGFIFISSYVNCDALAITSSAVVIYAWILGMKSNWDKKSCVFLIIGLSICVLSYQNAYGYILLTIFLFGFEIYRNYKLKKVISILKKGVLIFISVTILGGWFYIRNLIVYDGDLLGQETSRQMAEVYADDAFKPSNKSNPYKEGLSVKQMYFDKGWLKTSYKSFIGVFGNMNVQMPQGYYKLYTGIFSVGLICVLLSYKKLHAMRKTKKVFYSLIIGSIIFPICLSTWYSYFSDFQPQGRYVLSILLPLMLLLSKGIISIINKYSSKYLPLINLLTVIMFTFIVISIVINVFFATYMI